MITESFSQGKLILQLIKEGQQLWRFFQVIFILPEHLEVRRDKAKGNLIPLARTPSSSQPRALQGQEILASLPASKIHLLLHLCFSLWPGPAEERSPRGLCTLERSRKYRKSSFMSFPGCLMDLRSPISENEHLALGSSSRSCLRLTQGFTNPTNTK